MMNFAESKVEQAGGILLSIFSLIVYFFGYSGRNIRQPWHWRFSAIHAGISLYDSIRICYLPICEWV